MGDKARRGNPYDGHTLYRALQQVDRIAGLTDEAFVDMGYRGHWTDSLCRVHVDKRRWGRTSRSLWRWMKRRGGVEPAIRHLKRDHRMDINRLKGEKGEELNAILSAAGMKFRKLLS